MTALTAELTADGRSIVVVGSDVYEDELAFVASQIRGLTPLLKPSEPPGAVTLPLTWPAVVQLTSVVSGGWRPGPRLRRWVTNELAVRTQKEPGQLTIELPPELTPRPYQVDGALLVARTGHALISDEPGTGKTITAILGLLELAAIRSRDPVQDNRLRLGEPERGPVFPVVVVCPASVVDAWVDAWRLWAPSYTAVAWRGSPSRRRELPGTASVYVTSYDTARIDEDSLIRLGFASLVVDEHHMIKNHRAARTAAVRRLAKKANNVIALSGTPITHHPADLYPTLACLEPDAWPSRERWVHRYCLTMQGDYREEILGLDPGREDELRVSLLGQHRRVAKADVLAQLPPKVYSIRTVQLPPAHRKAYDALEKQMLAELPSGGELSVMTVLAQMTRLSQLASAPAEVTVTEEHTDVRLRGPSWKVDALLEVLEERPGKQVVVFAPSRQLIEIAQRTVREAGYTTGLVVGGQFARSRTLVIDQFQAGNTQVLFVTTGAGGTGITLTAASTVVFLQRPWSLVESLQAEDRCHRIGSEIHDSIEIIDIVASNTIDSRVRTALRAKGQQLADLVQDPRIVTELLGGKNVGKKEKERGHNHHQHGELRSAA